MEVEVDGGVVAAVAELGVAGMGSRKRGKSISWGQEAHWKESLMVAAWNSYSAVGLVVVRDEA